MGAGAATRQINAVGRPTVARVGDPRRRKASAWVIAALTALGVLAVVALVAGLILSNQGNEVQQAQVPDVTSRTLAIAQNDITNAGLKPVVGDQIFNDTCKEGQVAKQTPTGGQKVERQSEVVLQVCGGPEPVKIPTNLVGGTFEFAEARLKELGLDVKKEDVDGKEAKDTVLSLAPAEGTEVAKDSTVVVKVSKNNIRDIPNVVGKSEETARDQLESAGFKVRVLDGDFVDPEDAGQVTDQSKTGTGKVDETITITVTRPEEDNSPSPSPSPSPTASPTPEDG
jgi:beta-lactam-binding protein with PASTA domain